MIRHLLVFAAEQLSQRFAVTQVGSTPTEGIVAAVDVFEAADLLAASRFRLVDAVAPTHTLSVADFPSEADPRPVLLRCVAVSSVVAPAGLALPALEADDVPFVNLWQADATQIVYSAGVGATLAVVSGENKSAELNCQQVLSLVSAPSGWLLGGRTAA